MTLLYTDPRFLDHKTGSHPERPERLRVSVRHLIETGHMARCQQVPCVPLSLERLTRVHTPAYATDLQAYCAAGGVMVEVDTAVSHDSYDVALLAAGSACDAVDRVLQGPAKSALCLIRPPGHHALRGGPMGFCLFNNIAIAARTAITDGGLDRVLIVDWDVHHGNGTQDIFYDDGQVAFFSIHRWPFYPGTGAADETGTGAGLGLTKNVPLEFGISRPDFVATFRQELTAFADKVRPQLILISAGFDAHKDDPVGSLGLVSEDYIDLTKIVQDVANTHAGGRIVSLLEGGYNVHALAESIDLHLETLLR